MVKQPKKTAKARKPTTSLPLYVLSDSTGNLARHMVGTFLTQFPQGRFEVVLAPFIGERGKLDETMKSISQRPGIVLHATVAPQLKKKIARRCQEMDTECHDLTGTAMDFLASASGTKPLSDHQRLHAMDHAYCERINAMSFTLEHDDGLGLDTLNEADIVLAGVSRTGKTPTSVYLAMQGYRTANVSLAIEAPVPQELRNVTRGKIVGLMIDPYQLIEIRGRRQSAWEMSHMPYADPTQVRLEIQWSRGIFAELRCPVLSVTNQAIEETAARVLQTLHLTQPSHRAPEGLS